MNNHYEALFLTDGQRGSQRCVSVTVSAEADEVALCHRVNEGILAGHALRMTRGDAIKLVQALQSALRAQDRVLRQKG